MAKDNKKDPPYSRRNPDNDYIKYTSITFEILALNLAIIWGGITLDSKFESISPTLLIVSVVMSMIATIYYLLMRLNQNK